MPEIKAVYDDDPDDGRPGVKLYQVFTVDEVMQANRVSCGSQIDPRRQRLTLTQQFCTVRTGLVR